MIIMKCENVKKDGKQCGSYAIQDSKFCYFHSPEMVSKRKKASAEGGSKLTESLEPVEPIQLEQQGSVVALLQDTINRVRRVRKDGSLDVKTANCIGFLAGKIVEANKITEKAKIEDETDSQHSELFDENPIESIRQVRDGTIMMKKRAERNLMFDLKVKPNPSKEAELRAKIKYFEQTIRYADDTIHLAERRVKLQESFSKLATND